MLFRSPWFNSWVGKIRWRRYRLPTPVFLGFSCGSAGKESACNAGDPGSTPGLGRSTGEGIGYPCQCSWASLVVQLVKNLPAMTETWVQFPGWEDSEKGKGYPLQYPHLENSRRISWRNPCIVYDVAKSWTQLSNFHFQ